MQCTVEAVSTYSFSFLLNFFFSARQKPGLVQSSLRHGVFVSVRYATNARTRQGFRVSNGWSDKITMQVNHSMHLSNPTCFWLVGAEVPRCEAERTSIY